MAKKKVEDMTKDERVQSEVRRLKRALRDLDPNKLEVVKPLIERAAFTSVLLKDLEEVVNEKGVTSEYQNGENQWGTKQSDEVKTLIALQKNYSAMIKTLADIAPAAKPKKNRLEELANE
ncbi:MAG: hypothetical protein LUG23_00215 [Oscillospiraceae bacterium]|nr:hypothetical protein [Oscillospiraceae bacterium]